MKLITAPLPLRTRHTFRISREAHDHYHNVFVGIEHDGTIGFGEAAPSEHFGEQRSRVAEDLARVEEYLGDDPYRVEPILKRIDDAVAPTKAVKTALDIALHDVIGKCLGKPLYMLFGVDQDETPLTSFTIGIDTVEGIRDKVHEASEFPILKIKLGTEYDAAILETVRAESEAIIRVDANGAWSAKEAVNNIRRCEEFGVEFVEQPVPAEDLAGLRYVRENVNVPIIADESVLTAEDIPRLAGRVDGINIKLMKCGGLREALRMVHTARAHGLMVMLGCRIESSLSITAAAHLSPLVDFADLDGNLLLADDPFVGVQVEKGKLLLPDAPGLGVEKRAAKDHL
jgi:L-alanine-DL-glutamate epimerase-like enolase superfamily enzyme